jgi:cell division protein FtsN
MERNRVLWVIFSISLFLVVVLAGGLYLLRPVTDKDAEVATGQTSPLRSFDAFEYVRGKSDLPPLEEETEEAEEMVIIVGEKEDSGEEEPEAAPPLPEKALSPVKDQQQTGTTPRSVAPVARTATPPAATPRTRTPASSPVARTPTPVSRAPAARTPATRTPSGRAQVAKPAPQPREVSVTEYWIQAGSYTSPSRAQEVVGVLEQQGLVSKITTRTLSDKTYYRVRIGPYMNKGEAEKFLEWVKAVKGFESSYISMVYAKRWDP